LCKKNHIVIFFAADLIIEEQDTTQARTNAIWNLIRARAN
jgi:hypothetical protein